MKHRTVGNLLRVAEWLSSLYGIIEKRAKENLSTVLTSVSNVAKMRVSINPINGLSIIDQSGSIEALVFLRDQSA